jgi:hypothetical protein
MDRIILNLIIQSASLPVHFNIHGDLGVKKDPSPTRR